jgi:hypothetical protein
LNEGKKQVHKSANPNYHKTAQFLPKSALASRNQIILPLQNFNMKSRDAQTAKNTLVFSTKLKQHRTRYSNGIHHFLYTQLILFQGKKQLLCYNTHQFQQEGK